MILTLKQNFSSAHLYNQTSWSPEENLKQFGKCYSPHGHGHNYRLEVDFYIEDQSLAPQVQENKNLLEELCNRLDHEHLNFVIPEFKQNIPTSENIALYFLNKFSERFSPKPIDTQIKALRLYETEDLWTEIRL